MATYIKPEAIKDGSLPIEKIDNVALDLADKVNALDDNGKNTFLNKINAMPATPSGDPMHWAYVAAGAEYNDTGVDIVKTGIYGDTIIHKAGYWYLGELGDISTDEIREIYVKSNHLTNQISCATALTDTTIRTNFPICNIKYTGSYIFGSTGFPGIDIRGILQQNRLIEVFNFRNRFTEKIGVIEKFQNIAYIQCAFINCEKLKKILGILSLYGSVDRGNTYRTFENCKALTEVRIYSIKSNVTLHNSPNLSNESILYMINHEAATSAITITLHADAYARATADAEILAALETHTNVSLASA